MYDREEYVAKEKMAAVIRKLLGKPVEMELRKRPLTSPVVATKKMKKA